MDTGTVSLVMMDMLSTILSVNLKKIKVNVLKSLIVLKVNIIQEIPKMLTNNVTLVK